MSVAGAAQGISEHGVLFAEIRSDIPRAVVAERLEGVQQFAVRQGSGIGGQGAAVIEAAQRE
jgi:hypothetical protein